MADSAFATLKLQVAAPPPAPGKLEFENWGFSKTLISDDQYSISRLSAKSLELCTENLGSETGSDVVATDCSGAFAASAASLDQETSCMGDNRERSSTSRSTSKTESRNDEAMKPTSRRFPPPLTTMSGSNPLQVRRHREGGRLIIEAVETPFRSPFLQAERSGGRLRLCYNLKDSDDSGPESPAVAETEEARDETESGMEELEGEMNVERVQRWSRCKERRHENEGLGNNWKPALWVATS